jgi:cytochrome c553
MTTADSQTVVCQSNVAHTLALTPPAKQTANDFRTKERANNPGMASVFRSMEQDDIEALNEYLAGLRLQSTAGRR